MKQRDLSFPKNASPHDRYHISPCRNIMNTTRQTEEKTDFSILIYLVLVILLIGSLLTLLIFFMTYRSTINLNDFIVFEETGYNDYGTFNAYVDWDAMEEKYGKRLKIRDKEVSDFGNSLQNCTPIEIIELYCKFHCDQTELLSNGDTVHFSWTIPESIDSVFNYKIAFSDGNHIIANMIETKTFDAFSGLELRFEGMSPNGHASILSYPEYYELDYRLVQSDNLKNNDIVTVEAVFDYGDATQYLENHQELPISMTKEYVVTGLIEYIKDFDDIPADSYELMKKKAISIIQANQSDFLTGNEPLGELTYCGYICKTDNSEEQLCCYHNELYLIYQYTLTDPDYLVTPTVCYLPVGFQDVYYDGEQIKYQYYESIMGYSSIGYEYLRMINGYLDPIQLYIELISNNDDPYQITCGDGYEQYSTYNKIEHLSDITDDFRNQQIEDNRKIIEMQAGISSYTELEVGEVTYLGDFLDPNQPDYYFTDEQTNYSLVYSAVINNLKADHTDVTVYFIFSYEGLHKSLNNQIYYASYYSSGMHSYVPESRTGINGYLDFTELCQDYLLPYESNNNREISESLKEMVVE